MNNVIRHIEYLISRLDCVIVPGFGAFLAQYQSAHLDPASSTLFPPRRSFTFNSSLNTNDGILANSISRALGISYDRAVKVISQEVTSMKHDLLMSNEVSIGKVGIIRYDKVNATYQFEQFDNDRLSAATLWLSPLELQTIQKTEAPAVNKVPERKHYLGFFTTLSRIAAVAVLVLGVWLLASTPLHIEDAMKASLIPEINYSSGDNASDIQAVDHEAETNTQNIITTDASDPLSVDASAEEVASVTSEPNFYVIVGVSNDFTEAEKFLKMYPDLDLKIKAFGNQYRVYISAHDTNEEAALSCIEAKKSFPNAWFCRK